MEVLLQMIPLHAKPDDQPPPLTWARALASWDFDPWLMSGLLLTLGLYLYGVFRLHRRGDKWPLARTLNWCIGGVGTAFIATASALGVYDTVLFSVHMVQHMILNMTTPVFLALGAPITLLLRNLSGKPHRVALKVLHSWLGKLLLFPPLAAGIMILNPIVLYMTPLYEFTMRNDLAHDLLHLHYVLSGCAYFWPLVGKDPGPYRLAYPIRLLMFFLIIPFHSFVAVTIMGQPNLIAEKWYLSFERYWGPSPLADQYIAGGIMWGAADITMLSAMVAIFVEWYQDSRKEARRVDRKLDRLERLQQQSHKQSD